MKPNDMCFFFIFTGFLFSTRSYRQGVAHSFLYSSQESAFMKALSRLLGGVTQSSKKPLWVDVSLKQLKFLGSLYLHADFPRQSSNVLLRLP